MYDITNDDFHYAATQARYKQRKYPHIDEDELISAAYEGLVLAAKTFNPNFGIMFTSYAQKPVHQKMNETIKFLSTDCAELLDDVIIDPHTLHEKDCIDYSCLSQEEVEFIDTIITSGLTAYQYAKENNLPDSTLYAKLNDIKRKLKKIMK